MLEEHLSNQLASAPDAGLEAILAGPAAALAQAVDFSVHRRLLDIGGGTGSWSISVAGKHQRLRATVMDRSGSGRHMRLWARRFGLGGNAEWTRREWPFP